MSVDLRFSQVSPPAEEPKRTIYGDIVSLPDPVYLGTTVRIFNNDSVTLYMRVDGSGTGWTFQTFDLGALAAGSDMYRNLDRLASRAKPASALQETITVRLRAYTDAGYSNLKWTYERSILVVFIKSDDGTWTSEILNNFDDGTLQTWSGANDTGAGSYSFAVATDYVLSPPYSAKSEVNLFGSAGTLSCRQHVQKSIAAINKNIVLAIIDFRLRASGGTQNRTKWLEVRRDGTVLCYLGRPYDTVYEDYVPKDKWLRVIVLLPKNTALTLSIYHWACVVKASGDNTYNTIWLDDFKVISKD